MIVRDVFDESVNGPIYIGLTAVRLYIVFTLLYQSRCFWKSSLDTPDRSAQTGRRLGNHADKFMGENKINDSSLGLVVLGCLHNNTSVSIYQFK